MPIPGKQLQQLNAALDGHAKRNENLKDQIKHMQEEVLVHETLLNLGRDSKLLGALNTLVDDPKAASNIAERADTYFAEKGVKFPPGTKLRVKGGSSQLVIEADIKQGHFEYKAVWEQSNGFSSAPADKADERSENT